jgi:hypothetical protein
VPSRRFFNRTTALVVIAYPQDAAGGELPGPGSTTIGVPCCVQQDSGPEPRGEGQGRRGSTAMVRVYFGPNYSTFPDAALIAVKALKVNDRLALDDGRVIVLDGPAFDESGRGVVWEAAGKDIR